jgi:dCMP deaminase
MTIYDRLYMDIAERYSKMSCANKKKVGAVIVKNNTIISSGFNCTPFGFDKKCEDINGNTYWYVLHAEANAISNICRSRQTCNNSTLYITMSPCKECSKLILQSGIKKIVYKEKYKDISGLNFLGNNSVKCIQMKEGDVCEDELLVNLENGEIKWDQIKKLYKDEDINNPNKKYICKKCNKPFYCKNYKGEYPLCIDHRHGGTVHNTFKK